MKKTTITLTYDEERLTALKLYLAEKQITLEDELVKSLDALFARTVPQPVRRYIELRNGERQGLKQCRSVEEEKRFG